MVLVVLVLVVSFAFLLPGIIWKSAILLLAEKHSKRHVFPKLQQCTYSGYSILNFTDVLFYWPSPSDILFLWVSSSDILFYIIKLRRQTFLSMLLNFAARHSFLLSFHVRHSFLCILCVAVRYFLFGFIRPLDILFCFAAGHSLLCTDLRLKTFFSLYYWASTLDILSYWASSSQIIFYWVSTSDIVFCV